jgi:hypothetical protein
MLLIDLQLVGKHDTEKKEKRREERNRERG